MKFNRYLIYKKTLILLILIIFCNFIAVDGKTKLKRTYNKFPFQNPIGNLAAGIGNSLVEGAQKFIQCFPKEWLEPPKKDGPLQKMLDFLSKIIGILSSGLRFFLKIFSPIENVICKNKNFILNLIKKAFVRRLKFRESEEVEFKNSSTKSFLRRYKNSIKSLNYREMRWGVLSAINNTAQQKIEQAKNLAIQKVFTPLFTPIKSKIEALMNKVKGFFMGGFLGKIFKCSETMQKVLYKFKPIFMGLLEKFKTMIKYAAIGAQKIIMFFIDIMLGQFCDKVNFRKGLKLIEDGVNSNNKNKKFYLTGMGLGYILKNYSLKKIRV